MTVVIQLCIPFTGATVTFLLRNIVKGLHNTVKYMGVVVMTIDYATNLRGESVFLCLLGTRGILVWNSLERFATLCKRKSPEYTADNWRQGIWSVWAFVTARKTLRQRPPRFTIRLTSGEWCVARVRWTGKITLSFQ